MICRIFWSKVSYYNRISRMKISSSRLKGNSWWINSGRLRAWAASCMIWIDSSSPKLITSKWAFSKCLIIRLLENSLISLPLILSWVTSANLRVYMSKSSYQGILYQALIVEVQMDFRLYQRDPKRKNHQQNLFNQVHPRRVVQSWFRRSLLLR